MGKLLGRVVIVIAALAVAALVAALVPVDGNGASPPSSARQPGHVAR